MSSAPPGWYEDPGVRAEFRWWDGRHWTAWLSDDGGEPPPLGEVPGRDREGRPYAVTPAAPQSAWLTTALIAALVAGVVVVVLAAIGVSQLPAPATERRVAVTAEPSSWTAGIVEVDNGHVFADRVFLPSVAGPQRGAQAGKLTAVADLSIQFSGYVVTGQPALAGSNLLAIGITPAEVLTGADLHTTAGHLLRRTVGRLYADIGTWPEPQPGDASTVVPGLPGAILVETTVEVTAPGDFLGHEIVARVIIVPGEPGRAVTILDIRPEGIGPEETTQLDTMLAEMRLL